MSLLPPNATAQERAIEGSVSRLGSVPVPIDQLWNPSTCPASLLPWLAWAMSVDYWDENWSEAQKRNAIRQSFEIHRRKGTRGAVQKALDSIAAYSIIKEKAQDETLDAYEFDVDVQVEGEPVTELVQQRTMSVINQTKNVRSHLRNYRIAGTVRGTLNLAAVALGGEVASVYPYAGGQVAVNGSLYCAAAAVGYQLASVYPGSALTGQPIGLLLSITHP